MALINTLEQINESIEEGLPGYNWIPKEWKDPNGAPPPLEDTVTKGDAATIKFTVTKLTCKRDPETRPGEEKPKGPNGGAKFKHGFTKWVHPGSDFTHVDPPLFNDTDMSKAKDKLEKDQFDKLKQIVGRESLGMQRLACLFEWVLCRATQFLAQVNEGLGVGENKKPANHATYSQARRAYIDFLKDLDEREPEVDGKVIPGESGYGRVVKWAYIYPIISGGKIIGARVAIQWNPHSSSNGIPIPHG